MKVLLLFSDGTWRECEEIIKEETIANHWWPFPLDIEGDPRRKVKIIKDFKIIEEQKGV